MSSKNVMLIGLDPAVVNYDRWPDLTAEKLEAGLRRDETALKDSGYNAEICFNIRPTDSVDAVKCWA